MNRIEKAEKIVCDWVKEQFSDRVLNLIEMANDDLYNGPSNEDNEYPGFVNACEEIRKNTDDYLNEIWVDLMSEQVEFKEPTGFYDEDEVWVDACWEEYFYYSRREVMEFLMGSELASHI